ncbi:hypothetical protein ZWY2020_027859 [Hordeum vulgare]|nr:hypothetical protein ZWY2020_027859 [Hordeum vulgare]
MRQPPKEEGDSDGGKPEKLQEDLARVTDAMSAMQKMMSTGGLPNGLMGEPAMPPSFQQGYAILPRIIDRLVEMIGPDQLMLGVQSGSSVHLLAGS